MCRRPRLCGCHNRTEQRWFKKCQNVLRTITHSGCYHSNKHKKKKKKRFKGWFKIFSSIAGKVIMMCSWSQNVLSREILTGDVSCWTIEDTVNLLQLPLVLLSQWGCHAGLTRTPEPSQDCTEQLSTIQLNTNHFDYSLRKTFSDSSFLNVKMICFLSSSRTVNWLWPKQDIWGRHLQPFYDFL